MILQFYNLCTSRKVIFNSKDGCNIPNGGHQIWKSYLVHAILYQSFIYSSKIDSG